MRSERTVSVRLTRDEIGALLWTLYNPRVFAGADNTMFRARIVNARRISGGRWLPTPRLRTILTSLADAIESETASEARDG
jgi:hypothetical protein